MPQIPQEILAVLLRVYGEVLIFMKRSSVGGNVPVVTGTNLYP
jgi:hypothetical protein